MMRLVFSYPRIYKTSEKLRKLLAVSRKIAQVTLIFIMKVHFAVVC